MFSFVQLIWAQFSYKYVYSLCVWCFVGSSVAISPSTDSARCAINKRRSSGRWRCYSLSLPHQHLHLLYWHISYTLYFYFSPSISWKQAVSRSAVERRGTACCVKRFLTPNPVRRPSRAKPIWSRLVAKAIIVGRTSLWSGRISVFSIFCSFWVATAWCQCSETEN